MTEPQSSFELKGKLMNEHGDRYREFTRFLIALSAGFITLSVPIARGDASLLLKYSLVAHLLSLFGGLVVQHQIMMAPIHHLCQAERLQQASPAATLLELRRSPSTAQRVLYKLQITCFLGGFALIAAYFLEL